MDYVDKEIDNIKNMIYGDCIIISHDEKKCFIKKSNTYNSYIFCGKGSKNILKYFMKKTNNYNIIVQITDGNIRQFMPLCNWRSFWEIYNKKPIIHRFLFELILSTYPCKPYLDIEWKKESDVINMPLNNFIDMLRTDLIYIFYNRYNISITKNNILILSSHSNIKISFHIIINKIINKHTLVYRTNIKNTNNSAWDLYIALINHNEIYKKILDGSVYSTDREYRTIYSNKSMENRPFVQYNKRTIQPNKIKIMNNNKCLTYMVTYSQYNKHHYIITPQHMEVIKTPYVNNKINNTDYIKYIISLVCEIHPSAEYTGHNEHGMRFSYKDKSELCYSGITHKSNGFYVFDDIEKGIIYMKCMSNNCPKIHILKKTQIKNLFLV